MHIPKKQKETAYPIQTFSSKHPLMTESRQESPELQSSQDTRIIKNHLAKQKITPLTFSPYLCQHITPPCHHGYILKTSIHNHSRKRKKPTGFNQQPDSSVLLFCNWKQIRESNLVYLLQRKQTKQQQKRGGKKKKKGREKKKKGC